jgi:hypothetical protein
MAHSCRTPVRKLSSAFLDMAIAVGRPVVPVRFVGGLPVAPVFHEIDFPVGMGQQDIHIGRPIPPEELRSLSYRDRRQCVIDAINRLGPPNETEEPLPPDPTFACTCTCTCNLSEGTLSEGNLSAHNLSEGTLSVRNLSEGTLSARNLSEGTLSEGKGMRVRALSEGNSMRSLSARFLSEGTAPRSQSAGTGPSGHSLSGSSLSEGPGPAMGHAILSCILEQLPEPSSEIAALVSSAHTGGLRVSTTPEGSWLAELARRLRNPQRSRPVND